MAKRQNKVKLHDEKKMDVAYDFGKVTIAASWNDVTLQQMCDFWKLTQTKQDELEKDRKEAKRSKAEIDETDEKYNVTDKDLLKAFSDIEEDKIDILPVELYERLMGNLSFMVTPYEQKPASNKITINGNDFIINDHESLRLKEYTDAEQVIRNNRFDYPSLLAVLCRLKTGVTTDVATGVSWLANEVYDEEFATHKFDARREMFAKLPIADAMPLISFFLLRGIQSSNISQRSLMTAGHRLEELVENIESSLKHMDLSSWSKMRLKKTLKKYRKQISSILSTSSPT